MIVGMDFGTTNSGMAVYDGRSIHVLPLDPAAANPRVARTALYITNEQAVHIGRAAIDRYYKQNIGRVVKTRKVWIGEIEVYAEDLYYVTDAYAWVDVSEPGRLMLSIKTRLREEDHPGAVVGQFFYSLEDLIALYLTVTRVRAEQLLGRRLTQVVLGRPVHFSADATHDRLAQGRLLQAAFRAGYEKVYLHYEPVAAAFSYETTIDRPQNVLVFDFGGGTLDITVMRLGDPRARAVLATGGVPIAGDVFDQKLTRARLPKHFGEGSLHGPRQRPLEMPRWIFDAFSNWQTIMELQTPENKRILEEIARTAQRRFQIEALISLVSSNYGLKMFDAVERAKRLLSDRRGAEIRLDGPDFKVREFVTRSEFEKIIHPDILAIEAELARTLAASGLAAEEIDAVIRTGGSSQIPVFYELLCRRFGAEKVRSVDTFSSVTSGLGVIAHGIESGAIAARAYTPDDVAPPPQARGSRPQISSARLELLQKRILMDEGATQQATTAADVLLVLLGTGRAITAVSLPLSRLQARAPIPLETPDLSGPIRQALVVADPDAQLLLLTSHYRFLLITARQLLDMRTMGIRIDDLHHLAERETLCAVGNWSRIRTQEQLVLVTTRGYARAYPLNVLQSSIEAPVPLKFDHPLPGVAVAVLGADAAGADAAGDHAASDHVVLLSAGRRGARWPLAELPLRGLQALNLGQDDVVAAAALVQPEDELTLLTVDGYGRRLRAEWVEQPPRPNAHGKVLAARRSALAGGAVDPAWALTDAQLWPVESAQLPLINSTQTRRILKLSAETVVRCLFTTRA